MRIYSIREKTGHPQLVSTNRHISQGGVDLEDVQWDAKAQTPTGKSAVVKSDPYTLAVYLPAGWRAAGAQIGVQPVKIQSEGESAEVSFTPAASSSMARSISFEK